MCSPHATVTGRHPVRTRSAVESEETYEEQITPLVELLLLLLLPFSNYVPKTTGRWNRREQNKSGRSSIKCRHHCHQHSSTCTHSDWGNAITESTLPRTERELWAGPQPARGETEDNRRPCQSQNPPIDSGEVPRTFLGLLVLLWHPQLCVCVCGWLCEGVCTYTFRIILLSIYLFIPVYSSIYTLTLDWGYDAANSWYETHTTTPPTSSHQPTVIACDSWATTRGRHINKYLSVGKWSYKVVETVRDTQTCDMTPESPVSAEAGRRRSQPGWNGCQCVVHGLSHQICVAPSTRALIDMTRHQLTRYEALVLLLLRLSWRCAMAECEFLFPVDGPPILGVRLLISLPHIR